MVESFYVVGFDKDTLVEIDKRDFSSVYGQAVEKVEKVIVPIYFSIAEALYNHIITMSTSYEFVEILVNKAKASNCPIVVNRCEGGTYKLEDLKIFKVDIISMIEQTSQPYLR